MASSYTTSLLVEKIADNEQENTWGTTMRANWDLEDKAIAQIGTLTAAGGTTTVSDANFAYNNLELTGTLTAAQVYLMPARAKTWWVRNQPTHGTFGVTVIPTGGTAVAIPEGWTGKVHSNGTTARLYNAFPSSCRLAFHSMSVGAATATSLANSAVTTITDPLSTWNTSSNYFVIPQGYSYVRITVYAASNLNATEDALLLVVKNAAIGSGGGSPTTEPANWKVTIPSSLTNVGGTNGASVVLIDACTVDDYYVVGFFREGASSLNFHGDILVELIP
jgi:hypothetical protein